MICCSLGWMGGIVFRGKSLTVVKLCPSTSLVSKPAGRAEALCIIRSALGGNFLPEVFPHTWGKHFMNPLL